MWKKELDEKRWFKKMTDNYTKYLYELKSLITKW